jgi:hypothetical protein
MLSNEVRLVTVGTLLIISIGVLTDAFLNHKTPKVEALSQGSYACKADVYMCPDGTSVGRIAPYCQFASCPRQ